MFKKVHEAGMVIRFHTDGHINDLFGDLLLLSPQNSLLTNVSNGYMIGYVDISTCPKNP
jgi:hypothetical protein